MITEHNIEEYLFRSVEQDLSSDEQLQLDTFLQQHPEYIEEFHAYQSTILVPPTDVVFENKKTLLRNHQPSTRIIIPIFWRAAAILILLVSSLAAYYYFSDHFLSSSSSDVVMNTDSSKDTSNNLTPNQIQLSNTSITIAAPKPEPIKKRKSLTTSIAQQEIKDDKINSINLVTIKNDTTPNYKSIIETVQSKKPIENLVQPQPALVQAETLTQIPAPQHLTKLDKNLNLASRWLRLKGKDKLATGIEYVAQLKDKEIEISYNSRYLNFQKSFSLSKL